ncbi:MAG: hypothetical protein ACP5N5_06745, partial [Desulfurococcus sp.]|uniref:hypothetical protein n=1 Tax=Desulfurococcus sp. TaxID=51678 RepID=UPI003D103295
ELEKLGLGDKAGRYMVRAVPIYLEPADARELLDAAVRHLSADVEKLKQAIDNAEKERSKRALARLQRDLEYKTKLLEAFRKFMEEHTAVH